MIYAIEIRAETTITKRLLRTVEIRNSRYITGNTLQDRIRNEDICNIRDIQGGPESGNEYGEIV